MATFQEKMLTCRDCSAEFAFTIGEQEFYAEKGLLNEPGRCPACRSARRERQVSSRGFGSGSAQRTSRREFYTAICSQCGGEARVPFAPRGDRPVYCSDCYEQVRQRV